MKNNSYYGKHHFGHPSYIGRPLYNEYNLSSLEEEMLEKEKLFLSNKYKVKKYKEEYNNILKIFKIRNRYDNGYMYLL